MLKFATQRDIEGLQEQLRYRSINRSKDAELWEAKLAALCDYLGVEFESRPSPMFIVKPKERPHANPL